MRLLIPIVVAFGMVALAAEDPAVTDFTKRVQGYAKIRDAAKGKVPSIPKNASPVQIEDFEHALVAEIRAARANAKQGDMFTPQVEPIFRRILKDNFSGAENKDARAVVKQGNPQHDLGPGEQAPVIAVNAVYPKSAPLSSVTPVLLLELPTLPKDIEYRFSGRTLILRDSYSGLIIDYIKEASPSK